MWLGIFYTRSPRIGIHGRPFSSSIIAPWEIKDVILFPQEPIIQEYLQGAQESICTFLYHRSRRRLLETFLHLARKLFANASLKTWGLIAIPILPFSMQ